MINNYRNNIVTLQIHDFYSLNTYHSKKTLCKRQINFNQQMKKIILINVFYMYKFIIFALQFFFIDIYNFKYIQFVHILFKYNNFKL